MSLNSLVAIAQVVVASLATGVVLREGGSRRIPWLVLTALAILIACAVAQWRDPALLIHVARSDAVLHGEPWRMLTSLWFQDGGIVGALLNFALLVSVGWAAEIALDARLWIFAYLTGGLWGGLAGLAWQSDGAGNSVAVLGLAGALFARTPRKPASLAGLAIAGGLVICHDIHGVAVLSGAAASAVAKRWAILRK